MSISCSNIDINFDGQHYLDDVSLKIDENKTVLLYGPSGSGKTTLYNIICGLNPPVNNRATVNWFDYEVGDIKDANKIRYKYISLIFSVFYFMSSLNVEENIIMPAVFAGVKKDKIKERLEVLYDVFSFDGKNANLNLSSLRKMSVSSVSNGQRELVGIARAFMLDSKFIFADEMLRSYNIDAENALWDIILTSPELGIGTNRGLFMITHKEHLKEDSRIDEIYTIKDKDLVKIK